MLEIRMGEGGVVFLSGRFDASQAAKAREAFAPIERSLTADLSDLHYISSAGIGFLMAVHKRLHESGESMTLVNVTPRIRNILRLAGLDKILVIE